MKRKICFIVAIPGTARSFLRNHIERLSNDYDVYLAGNIQNPKDVSDLKISGLQQIDINRNISIKEDMKALSQLMKYFKKMSFDAVHSITPKAGLLTALAGTMANIPVRIHIFTGQVWATRKGLLKKFLKFLDWLIVRLDTNILVDGKSQRDYLVKNRILKENEGSVLGEGSICGVNTDLFIPAIQTRDSARKEIGISDDRIVFVFMGRLNRDKGIHELLEAFDKLAGINKSVYLLLIGSDEENLSSSFQNYSNIKDRENFLYYGKTDKPYYILQAGDVFVLPSYREGFGMSVIEASSIGLPVITSDAYGVLDAVVEGETGLRCKVMDSETLYDAMKILADNKELREKLGVKGRERVLSLFSSESITSAWAKFYHTLIPINS